MGIYIKGEPSEGVYKLTYQDTTDKGRVAVLEGDDIVFIGQIDNRSRRERVMGLYIKGMKMPKEGRYAVIRVIPDGTVFAECLGIGDGTEELPKLKAVEVKEPHGRLVDIDKAMRIVATGVRVDAGEMSELTTVIEAEGSE